MRQFKFIYDAFTTARGEPALLKIFCSCKQFLMYYQKDGPGPLKRCYLDRILYPKHPDLELRCSVCQQLIGIPILYEKEQRRALLLMDHSHFVQVLP